MNFIIKFLLTVFFNFIALEVFTIDIPEDLIVKIIKESKNEEDIKSNNLDLISVKYTGWIFDSNAPTNNYCEAKGKMFDSNILDKFHHTQPFQFVLGSGLVIKGWEMGLQNMKINDVRCLVIPPKLAYGNRKMGNILEANSTLIFEIQLLDIINLDTEEKE